MRMDAVAKPWAKVAHNQSNTTGYVTTTLTDLIEIKIHVQVQLRSCLLFDGCSCRQTS